MGRKLGVWGPQAIYCRSGSSGSIGKVLHVDLKVAICRVSARSVCCVRALWNANLKHVRTAIRSEDTDN
eukprot:6187501-Pleurochrysis_carterae.AAC.1